MKNHFFTAYSGNKREEVKKIYNNIDDINKYHTIIEPFCGTSAFSYYVWTLNKDKNIKYILNDNNIKLIELYKLCKNEEKWTKLNEDLKDLYNSIDTKEKYDKIAKEQLSVKNKNSKYNIVEYLFINKCYTIRPGMYYQNKKININLLQYPIIEFLRTANIEIICDDALNVYKTYKDDDKALIFLDPPYLNSHNEFYYEKNINIYEYLHNNNINKENSKIILCLEKNWIIELLFKDNKFIEYDKLYQMNKKKTKHIIIINEK